MQDLDAGAVGLVDPLLGELAPVHLQHGELLLQHDPQILLVREGQHDGRPEWLLGQAPSPPYQLPHVVRRRLQAGRGLR